MNCLCHSVLFASKSDILAQKNLMAFWALKPWFRGIIRFFQFFPKKMNRKNRWFWTPIYLVVVQKKFWLKNIYIKKTDKELFSERSH